MKTPSRGFTTGTVMISITVCFLLLSSFMMVSSSQLNLTNRNVGRMRAVLMAEAGVDASLITLTGNWDATTATGTLYEDPGTNQTRHGDYSCAISVIDSTHRRVVATGTEFTGRTAGVVAIINREDVFLSKFAMLANGAISINGTVSIATTPVNQHTANVHSNQNIAFGSNSTVDGTLDAVGTITGGTGYYPNAPGSEYVPFPDAAQVTAWKTTWLTEAQAGHTYNAANLFNGNKTTVTIDAPAYIVGDVSLNSSQTLILQGAGTVWVQGNVRLTANSTLDNRAFLVTSGNFSQSGQSLYKTGSNGSFTPTMVTLSGDSDVAGGGVAQGIIYAAGGSLKVTGNSGFYGSLIAAGSISATGTYNQYYPTNQSDRVAFLSPPHVEKLVEL